jgi:hypothetical protein
MVLFHVSDEREGELLARRSLNNQGSRTFKSVRRGWQGKRAWAQTHAERAGLKPLASLARGFLYV